MENSTIPTYTTEAFKDRAEKEFHTIKEPKVTHSVVINKIKQLITGLFVIKKFNKGYSSGVRYIKLYFSDLTEAEDCRKFLKEKLVMKCKLGLGSDRPLTNPEFVITILPDYMS